jgi:Zn-dependent protease
VLFALGQPFVFVGLLISFLLALLLRAYAIRITARSLGLIDRRESVAPQLREDVDPFGAVAAAVGGPGWGRVIDVDEVPRFRGRGRAALVFLAGPLVVLIAAQLALLAFTLLYPNSLIFLRVSDILRGLFDAPVGAQVLLGLAGGLLAFGLLALLPIPPLDGFGLLWSAQRVPGRGMQGYRLWFQEKNLGVVVLLACCFLPLSYPLILLPVDLIGTVFLRLWG